MNHLQQILNAQNEPDKKKPLPSDKMERAFKDIFKSKPKNTK